MDISFWRKGGAFFVLLFCTIICMAQPKRIITLGGAITETVAALGFEKHIVAVDVTSEYPVNITKLPKVSKSRSVSAEGLMAFRPDLVIAPAGAVPYGVIQSLKGAGIRFVAVQQEYSVKGALNFIRSIGEALDSKLKAEKVALEVENKVNNVLQIVHNSKLQPKVLFIYARGAGTMTVAGKGSNMDAIIGLAGGRNAIKEFNQYKTYSTEALVHANPDVLLMFDFGMDSLGGKAGVLEMPGVLFTNAGKTKKIVPIDGPLMINFSTRLDQAILSLHKLIN